MCRLIDSSLIVPRLRIAWGQLCQVNNQLIYLGRICPASVTLNVQVGNRLFLCIEELNRIVRELEPKKVDTGSLTLEEDHILSGYAEIKLGLLKSWEFIESRQEIIIKQAGIRIADQQGAGQ